MKLDILLQDESLEVLTEQIKNYFDAEIKIFRCELSLFEQYEIRTRKKFVPKIWDYRIVHNNNKFKFGKLMEEEIENSNT